MTFPINILATAYVQNPKRIFPISVTVPLILVAGGGKRRAPQSSRIQMVKNWFQSVTRVRRAVGEKNPKGISMFSCVVKPVTLVLTSLYGICKPEAEIHQNRKSEGDVKTFQRDLSGYTTQFWARPIHFHLRRHRPTIENTIRYKPEVETVP